mmetsp:Transcript_30040/g.86181  ORF Transcript_30040/g.86181 Transcript_30040/m.86181 type:complete len:218 (+) Transcript_30040:3104-3757(+)
MPADMWPTSGAPEVLVSFCKPGVQKPTKCRWPFFAAAGGPKTISQQTLCKSTGTKADSLQQRRIRSCRSRSAHTVRRIRELLLLSSRLAMLSSWRAARPGGPGQLKHSKAGSKAVAVLMHAIIIRCLSEASEKCQNVHLAKHAPKTKSSNTPSVSMFVGAGISVEATACVHLRSLQTPRSSPRVGNATCADHGRTNSSTGQASTRHLQNSSAEFVIG